MSYYRPSYSQTVAMSRGRGFSSTRGSSYRGNSRGSSWGGGRGGYSSRGGNRFTNSFSNSFDSRSKYPGSNDKYGQSRSHGDEYRKPYKPDSGGYPSSRDHRSPERKRMRTGSSHDRSFGGSSEYNSRYESDRRSFSSDRRPAPFVRKEEFRKPPPPSSSPRGGYRGRISSRGSMRARLRDRPGRRRLLETSYTVKRRIIGRSSDYVRRLKISRMRSAIIRRPKREDMSDKEDSENEDEDKDMDHGDIKEEDDRSDKDENDEDKKLSPKKSPKMEEDVSDKEEQKDSDQEEKRKTPFIKLTCPHCGTRCATFGKYSMHLQSGRHAIAMRRVAMKQKSILSQMRLVQRKAQRELEKTTDDLAPRTSWCPLCKLNYKQPKLTHQASEAHKNMKKFLMPYCKICKLTFKSPMIYESHCCSIEHIKRKALLSNGDKSDKEESDHGEDVMDNFMTIDSVGDMDEDGDSNEKKEGMPETKPKKQINVGIENIKKIQVYYCDLCRMYLPRAHDDDEMNRILSRHCKLRTHLQKYIRYKEDKELAKRAERLQRKETAEKEKEKDKDEAKEGDEKEETKKEAKVKGDPNTSVEEEKIWADVDKDLGDILAEASSCHKSSDEDEEDSVANGERYDRFKYSEKNGEELKKVEEKVAEEKKEMEEGEVDK